MRTEILHDIEQARAGNTSAFERIVRRYQSLISGILYSITGDFHRSEDLAQETFLIAWNKLGELRNTDDIAPWLCTIARNLAYRAGRKKTETTVEPENIFQEKPSEEPEPDRELQRQEQSELIWSAIGEIPETYRETLVLYYRSGQSAKEIAAATNSSVDAVNQRLVRARRSLKGKLEEIVGEILTETAPGDAFTFSVISAITAGAVVSTAQTALAATTATTATATGGKAVGVASLWAILGPLAIVVWYISIFWCTFYLVIRNVPTLPGRRFQVYSLFWGFQYFPLFTFGGLVPLGAAIIYLTSSPPIFMFLCMITTFGVGLYYQYRNQKTIKNILKADLGLPASQVASYSFEQVERQFRRAIFTNFLLIETIIAYLTVLAILVGINLTGLLVFLVAQTVFVLTMIAANQLGRHLLEICRTPQSLLENPPIVEKPFEVFLDLSSKVPVAVDLSKKAKKTFFLLVFGWVNYIIVAAFCAYFYLNWQLYPVEKIVTLILIVGSILGHTYVCRLCKTRSQFRILTSGLFFLGAVLILYLGTLETENVLFIEMLRDAFRSGFHSGVVPMWSVMTSVLFIFMGFLQLFFCFFESRGLKNESKNQQNTISEGDAPLQEAILEFERKKTHLPEENIERKAFPTLWFWICVAYATVVSVLFLTGAIFANFR